MKRYNPLLENNKYSGSHTAPTNDGYSKPLYDLTDIYPEDIYSSQGASYYGDGSPYDNETISIISRYKGYPNKSITIYRAVPDLNKEVDTEIKELLGALNFYTRFNFYPPLHKKGFDSFHPIEEEIEEQWQKGKLGDISYDEYQQYLYDFIDKKIEELKKSKGAKIKINKGDWISINRKYAVDHGKSHLGDYKIISKTVKAKEVWTDGNSIHEWGYDK